MDRHEIETTLAELAAELLERSRGRERRFVLGIAGPPGAGKSGLAAQLRELLNGQAGAPVAEVAPMDGFHLSNAQLRATGALRRKGEPDTFDVGGYLEALRKLRESPRGQWVSWPIYDRERHEPVPDAVGFDRHSIVITEGNYLLLDDFGTADWSSVREYLDQSWYLDVPLEQLRERLLARHVRGGKSEEFAKSKVTQSDLMNAELVAKTLERADLVLRPSDRTFLVRSGSAV